MRNVAIICILVALAACVGPNEGESSIIAFSGPYKQKDKASPGLIYRTLSGDDSEHDRVVTATSGIMLENDAGDEYEITIHAGSHGSAHSTHLEYAYVKPGRYHLTGISLGHFRIDYNRNLCGDMAVTVNANETVYVGGLRLPDGADVAAETYRHILPQFVEETDANFYHETVKAMASRPARWHQGKTYRTALLANPIPYVPAACMETVKPLF